MRCVNMELKPKIVRVLVGDRYTASEGGVSGTNAGKGPGYYSKECETNGFMISTYNTCMFVSDDMLRKATESRRAIELGGVPENPLIPTPEDPPDPK